MTIILDKNELTEILLDSYDLMFEIPSPKPDKYEIKSRSKLKNLTEALREFEDPEASVIHFVKSASYFLPRSDSDLQNYLDLLLKKVQKIQTNENDPEKVREKIKYMIGYSNWSMDAVCNLFVKTKDASDLKKRLQTMIGVEFKILDNSEKVDEIVDKIMAWKGK